MDIIAVSEKMNFQKNEFCWTSVGRISIIRSVALDKTGRIRDREK